MSAAAHAGMNPIPLEDVPTVDGVYLDVEGQAWQRDETGWWGAGAMGVASDDDMRYQGLRTPPLLQLTHEERSMLRVSLRDTEQANPSLRARALAADVLKRLGA